MSNTQRVFKHQKSLVQNAPWRKQVEAIRRQEGSDGALNYLRGLAVERAEAIIGEVGIDQTLSSNETKSKNQKTGKRVNVARQSKPIKLSLEAALGLGHTPDKPTFVQITETGFDKHKFRTDRKRDKFPKPLGMRALEGDPSLSHRHVTIVHYLEDPSTGDANRLYGGRAFASSDPTDTHPAYRPETRDNPGFSPSDELYLLKDFMDQTELIMHDLNMDTSGPIVADARRSRS